MNHQLALTPFFKGLENSQNILLAGNGGGHDIYSGLPIYYELKAMGKQVTLANLSFTSLAESTSQEVFPHCYEIQVEDSERSERNYFPEKFLKQFFLHHNENPTIYTFDRVGSRPLRLAYQHLIEKHKIDTVILVDGGTDCLMFGDEEGLGTPQEDISSIAAVNQCNVERKLLLSFGFGVDHYHGVSHFRFLENVAQISKDGGYLGLFQALPEMEGAQKFIEAIDFANSMMPGRGSIVGNSIASALENEYGNVHRTARTQETELWINPLMTIYWAFKLNSVAKRIKYYDRINDLNSMDEFDQQLVRYQLGLKTLREKRSMPA